MRNLRALVLLLYIIALFVIPVYHITDVSAAESDCSACFAEPADFSRTAVTERCEPDNPCHNPNHAHHNHPLHDHHCSLCASIQNLDSYLSPGIGNPVLNFSSSSVCQPANDIRHNDSISQAIDIRGPPARA